MNPAKSVACALFFVLVSPLAILQSSVLYGQSTNAAVTGRVTDPQKSVIVGANVTAINTGTNVRYEGISNNTGSYVIPNLPPGPYRVEVERPGFKTIVETGVVLHVQDTVELNFEMALGAVSESVTVTADSTNINTTDGTVSTTIDRNFAENLPLNGRSFQTLILLAPGTVLVPAGAGLTNGGTFSVNGQRANTNDFTVDGVSANLGGYINPCCPGQLNGANPNFTVAGTTQGMVSVDTLQEFKIQTSTYAPEFGRQPGGQVSLLTRSGTNDFHGTAFDYVRNDVFDASNWFNGYEQNPPIAKGKERQNDFGGTIGGPIFKDKTFFFFSYEGIRLLQPFTNLDTVPSTRLRQEAAPAYQAILNSWPIPDGAEFTTPCDPTTDPSCPPSGMKPTGAAPYTISQSFPTSLDSYSIKIDHTFSRAHIFGRYDDAPSHLTNPNGGTNPNLVNVATLQSRFLTLGADMTLRPTLVNELRLNYSVAASKFVVSQNVIGGAQLLNTSILYPQPFVQGTDEASWQLSLPTTFFSTFPGPAAKFSQRQINIIDNVSYSVGSHQLKMGVDYRRLFPVFFPTPAGVSYNVTSESDLTAGQVSFAQVQSQVVAHPIYTNLSFYGQDTWKVSNRLTLTFGLRWDLNPAPGERDGIRPLNVIGLATDPATATLAPLNSPMYKTTYDNFAPRFGLAYQIRQSPRHESVLRTGFGVFNDLNSEQAAAGFGNAPFVNQSAPANNLSFPVANGVLSIPPIPAPLIPPYRTINAIDPNLELPFTLQWNVSIEQALGQSQSLTISYVGSAGYRLLRTDYLFNFSPNFQDAFLLRNGSSSNYESLQFQFNRRLSRGFQALASYTYSHSIDNASDAVVTQSASVTGTSFLNPNVDRGNSSFDLRQAFRGALTYNIPRWNANAVSKAILGGWSVDAIGVAQTGLPVDLSGGFYCLTVNFYCIQLRPNVNPGPPMYLYGSACAASNGNVPCPGGMRFNPAAFSSVPTDGSGNPIFDPGLFNGSLGRNVMRGFGAWQMDFALHRQFNITERVNLQFRSEFFNVFNHPNFGTPDNFVPDGIFGEATSTLNRSYQSLNQLYQIGGPRSIQFALKLQF